MAKKLDEAQVYDLQNKLELASFVMLGVFGASMLLIWFLAGVPPILFIVVVCGISFLAYNMLVKPQIRAYCKGLLESDSKHERPAAEHKK